VTTAVLGRTVMAASSTSPAPVPAGVAMVSESALGERAERALRKTTGSPTVSVVDADRPEAPWLAVIVVAPWATLLANPLEPLALLIVAAAVFDELQTTLVVRFCVELSL
jgi:hypothetical protein